MTGKTPNDWSKDAFLSKAQRYATLMLAQPRDEWLFGFWSALCLEMLLRASIASVSPALIADGKDWKNILYALDKRPPEKLSPRTADTSDMIGRAEALFAPRYTREMANFCVLHSQRRNAELHSGALPFDELGTSWLPMFYASCLALCESMGETLGLVFGEQEEKAATTQIQGLNNAAAKSVKSLINAHKTLWEEKTSEDRERLAAYASALSSRAHGHRVQCPACNSVGLVHGTEAGEPNTSLKDGTIVVRQPMLPSSFECKACTLKIMGYAKLNACGLGSTFTSTLMHDPIDYFEDEFNDRWSGMEEDNNEP